MKICIVKLSAMGDIIHAMVALQFVKKKYPNCQIDWIVEKSFKGVLEDNPHIDNILPIELKKIKSNKFEIFNQIKILKQYAKNNYDVVIDAQGLLKSAIVSRIVGNKIRGSYISGFDKNSTRESIASYFYDKKVSIDYGANVIKRNLKVICEPLGIFVNDEEIINKKNFLFYKEELKDNSEYIVFIVGASLKNKIYPKENFLELAQLINKKIIAVWGNEEEFKTATWLNEKLPIIKVAKKGNLNNLKEVISKASLIIGSDTGPTHMSWALGVPSITIFGNTPEERNTYITSINKVIKSPSKVNPLKLNKNDFSIKDIKASEIFECLKILKIK